MSTKENKKMLGKVLEFKKNIKHIDDEFQKNGYLEMGYSLAIRLVVENFFDELSTESIFTWLKSCSAEYCHARYSEKDAQRKDGVEGEKQFLWLSYFLLLAINKYGLESVCKSLLPESVAYTERSKLNLMNWLRWFFVKGFVWFEIGRSNHDPDFHTVIITLKQKKIQALTDLYPIIQRISGGTTLSEDLPVSTTFLPSRKQVNLSTDRAILTSADSIEDQDVEALDWPAPPDQSELLQSALEVSVSMKNESKDLLAVPVEPPLPPLPVSSPPPPPPPLPTLLPAKIKFFENANSSSISSSTVSVSTNDDDCKKESLNGKLVQLTHNENLLSHIERFRSKTYNKNSTDDSSQILKLPKKEATNPIVEALGSALDARFKASHPTDYESEDSDESDHEDNWDDDVSINCHSRLTP